MFRNPVVGEVKTLTWARAFRSPRSFPHTTTMASSLKMRPFTVESINPSLLNVQYAVRGELALKAEQYRDQLKEPDHGLPFDKIINSNIGNPQQKGLDQPPISFTRQVCLRRCPRVSIFTVHRWPR